MAWSLAGPATLTGNRDRDTRSSPGREQAVHAGDRSPSSHAQARRTWARCIVSRLCLWLIPSLVFGGRSRSRSNLSRTGS
jgi:hypothetical protein